MAETAVEREPQRPDGLTFAQPWERVGPRSGAKADALRAVLAEEVRRGHVSYDATTGRYSLNGGLDPELREALRSL